MDHLAPAPHELQQVDQRERRGAIRVRPLLDSIDPAQGGARLVEPSLPTQEARAMRASPAKADRQQNLTGFASLRSKVGSTEFRPTDWNGYLSASCSRTSMGSASGPRLKPLARSPAMSTGCCCGVPEIGASSDCSNPEQRFHWDGSPFGWCTRNSRPERIFPPFAG